ncbi:universal stress protein [Rufibacter soli]
METIVCPTDFTNKSENSIRYADEIAQRMNSRIILFHSITESAQVQATAGEVESYPSAEEMDLEGKQLKKLRRIQTYLESTEWGIPVSYETRVGYGETHQNVTTLAQDENADLIVLGSGLTDDIKEIVVNSLAGQVINHGPCPVLIIPENATFRPLRKIVLAADLRGFSLSDTAMVLKLANYFGAQIELLHIISKEDETARQFAQEELQRLSKRLPYQRVSIHVEVNTSVEQGISQYCRNQRADMLVVGAHATNPWQHLLQAEEAQAPTYRTHLPLMVIHARKIPF